MGYDNILLETINQDVVSIDFVHLGWMKLLVVLMLGCIASCFFCIPTEGFSP